MKNWLMFLALASGLLVASGAVAAIQTAGDFLAQVQANVESGQLSLDQALLIKFEYAFDRGNLPAEYRPAGPAPMRCATPLIVEFMETRDRLPADIRNTIEGYLAERDDPSRVYYYPPLGMFRLSYVTTGVDAVPLADTNGNGVPDYVERIGEYFDYSWTFEVTTMGFGLPPHSPYYNVTIKNLSGVYGVTYLTGSPGGTRIEIENDFIGFPPNDDPDGDALGAAKVTAAHEFKHATQYVTSGWSESGWVELDATWMEDIAYPATNDYFNYVNYTGSPITSPATSLDSGGSGSYEDCVWQHYMSQTWTNQIIIDFWNWRRGHQAQAVLTSYDVILGSYGSSIRAAWPLFATWNYACGARNSPGFGYIDGARYAAGSVQRQFTTYPGTYNGSVTHLAANWIRCLSIGEAGKHARITFNGLDTAQLGLTAYMKISAIYGGGYYYFPLELDALNDGVFELPVDLEPIYEIGVIVGNSKTTGSGQTYTVTIEKVDGQSTPVNDRVVPLFNISGNYPNPFNPATTIEFTLDRPGTVGLDLYDLRGQRVRTLVAETLAAGPHAVRWDGLDDSGRALPSGTYLARLSDSGRVTTHKLVLAK